jgi:hypothetical protein
MYQFNDQGKLRDYNTGRFLANIMTRRGLLNIDDSIYKSLPMIITGPAKSYLRLKVHDSTADSLTIPPEFEL